MVDAVREPQACAFSPLCFFLNSWFSRCVFQDRGQELVDGLKVCLQGGCGAAPGCGVGGLGAGPAG